MRNLVIVMAGDESLHEAYADGRGFELWVCYWGQHETVAERYRQSCDRLFAIRGQKWALVRAVGRAAAELGLPAFSQYDYVFLPDDDIAFAGRAADVNRAFALARDIGADIFQPAVGNGNTSPGWEAVAQVMGGCVAHASNVAEIMMPAYSGAIFESCVLTLLHMHPHIAVGWGIDTVLPRFAEAVLRRAVRTFVLDETPGLHMRPTGLGSSNYGIGWDERMLLPACEGVRPLDLGRFSSREAAAGFAFPAADAWFAADKMRHKLDQIRSARLFMEAVARTRPNGIPRHLLRWVGTILVRNEGRRAARERAKAGR